MGEFFFRKMVNHGVSFHRNGKMRFRGVWKDININKSKFGVMFKENGEIDFSWFGNVAKK